MVFWVSKYIRPGCFLLQQKVWPKRCLFVGKSDIIYDLPRSVRKEVLKQVGFFLIGRIRGFDSKKKTYCFWIWAESEGKCCSVFCIKIGSFIFSNRRHPEKVKISTGFWSVYPALLHAKLEGSHV